MNYLNESPLSYHENAICVDGLRIKYDIFICNKQKLVTQNTTMTFLWVSRKIIENVISENHNEIQYVQSDVRIATTSDSFTRPLK